MKIDRTSQLQRALERIGRDPARLEETLDQVIAQTGATAAELRAALAQGDRFASDQRAALEALLDSRSARTVALPGEGARAHTIRAQKHKPWFGAVDDKSALGVPLFREPPRDVEIAGKKLSKDELALILRGTG